MERTEFLRAFGLAVAILAVLSFVAFVWPLPGIRHPRSTSGLQGVPMQSIPMPIR